jgi:murein L,D-transpeptidase YcbB/YkuD
MLENLKFTLFTVVVLTLLGLFGYWAITTIKSGSEFQASKNLQQLQAKNDDLTKQIAKLTNQLNDAELQLANTNTTPTTTKNTTPVKTSTPATPPNTQPTKSTTYKNQSLINELQKLITDKISMKLNSSGTRVGTVQNFLNIYNKTSNKIDNNYGASTLKAVVVFQKSQGLTANGLASSSTFTQMINWLKKQG